jgi:hypothetical protein
LWQPSLQPQLSSQQRWQQKIRSSKQGRQRCLQHLLQPLSQPHLLQPLSQPQLGFASQPQVGAAFASQPQVGAFAVHVGFAAQLGLAAQLGFASHPQDAFAQQLFAPQPPQRDSQQRLSQPQPLTPSIRSSKSKPKLCEQRPKPSTIVPTRMFHFIEPCLLFDGTVELALPSASARSDYRITSHHDDFLVWEPLKTIRPEIFRGMRWWV